MTIHSGHPFETPAEERDPIRRLRGRLGGTVTLWTAGDADGARRAGLPVSSRMVAAGEPAHVLALLDPEADLTELLLAERRCVLQLLGWHHRTVADAFAGSTPAPGGPFRLASWEQSAWGPVLADASGWAGLRLVDEPPRTVGWSLLVDTVVEHVQLEAEGAPLVHYRGRYQRPDAD